MTGPLIWMIATAVMTVTILTIGTLASAGIIFGGDREAASSARAGRPSTSADREVASTTTGHPIHRS